MTHLLNIWPWYSVYGHCSTEIKKGYSFPKNGGNGKQSLGDTHTHNEELARILIDREIWE